MGRDFFDRLYSKLPRSEREVLRAFAELGKPANISDIARKIKKRHATTLALRLAERGQLERVDRGLYRVFNRLYGRYAMERG
jgi:predicted transcriptional regulator of viral defense system